MHALLEHPDQMQLLRDDPELLDRAIEEILRWATPVIHFRRTATADTEVGGQAIAEGDALVMFYMSANRDEAVFDDPFTFDITRDPNDHIAFGGGGAHHCLGANLARLELQIIFKELLASTRSITQAGDVAAPPLQLHQRHQAHARRGRARLSEVLTTGRLRLTPLTVSDAEALLAVYADPAMFEFTGGSVPTPPTYRTASRRRPGRRRKGRPG